MNKNHRKILRELMGRCNELGGVLDGTSTNEAKYRDRQRAHMLTYKILYAVLADHPDNEHSADDFEVAITALRELEILTQKTYPDRNGIYNH